MIVESIGVRNFRSILDETLRVDRLTALVGANGSGKSSFLRALELFYAGNPKFDREDFYNEDAEHDIEITVTFGALTPNELERFGAYVQDSKLAIVRVLSLQGGKTTAKFYGSLLRNPDFSAFRRAQSSAERKTEYEKLKKVGSYADLKSWTSQTAAAKGLEDWETKHPEKCERQRDEGQFFGFTEVGVGYLDRHTKLIPIPAVREAADEGAEGKGSAITVLMDLVVRRELSERQEINEFREKTRKRYQELIDPAKLPELRKLESKINETLRAYVQDAAVSLSWQGESDVDIPMPRAAVRLAEDGYVSSVDHTGHGLQRAFILTMLQHLAVAGNAAARSAALPPDDSAASGAAPMPNILLAIEEPELYQHPDRQRHLAKVLIDIADGAMSEVVQAAQVIYCTHSPFFVGIDRFEQVRLLRKRLAGSGRPKTTTVTQARLEEIAQALWEANGKHGAPYTAETLRPRLQTVMTLWVNEGFFSQVVVLVEGETDRSAIMGAARAVGHDFEASGISVIPCMGKNNLDRPLLIFRALQIPTYLVWDSDYGKSGAKAEDNRRLLRLIGKTESDWPAFVRERAACFKTDLETTLRDEIGADTFGLLLLEAAREFGIPNNNDALKNPVVLQHLIAAANSQGKSSKTLASVVEQIAKLRLNPTGL